MGCCEYKNVSREIGEVSQTDSVSRISEKYFSQENGIQKEPSNLNLKLKKITFDGEEKKYAGNEEEDFYDIKQQAPYIPLENIIQEKGNY